MNIRNEVRGWLAFIALAGLGGFILSLVYKTSYLEVLRIIFGVVYVLFLPGYVAVRCYFDDLEDWIEKFAVSFGLSIAIVVLSVIIANLVFRIRITPVSSLLVILATMLIMAGAKYLYVKKPWIKNKHPVQKAHFKK